MPENAASSSGLARAGTNATGSAGTASGAIESGSSGAMIEESGSTTDGPAAIADAAASMVDAGAGNSVLQRANHLSRDGQFVQPTLTKAAAARMMPDATFNTAATFTGAVWSSPLYVETGPAGKGIYVVATTGNDVIAFDENGTQVWKRNVGASANQAANGWCGNIHPIGILSTPVIDPTAAADGFATIYVSAAIGTATAIDHQEVHALSANDGSERTGWLIKLDASIMAGNDGLNLVFNVNQNQRGALSLVHGILYVPFGGQDGDCNAYHGWVIAIDTAKAATVSAWATRSPGGAIWAAGGMASDGNGVFAVTGNANYGGQFGSPPNYQDNEGVLRISGMPLARSDFYYPVRWKSMDIADQDMGASSSLLMQVPGATPATYVVAVSKDGHLYVLNSQSLGMMEGQVIDLPVASIPYSVRTSPITYTSAMGTYIALTIDRGVMGCPGAINIAEGTLMALSVTPNATPSLKVAPAWCAQIQGQVTAPGPTEGNRTAAPIVTTSDGKNDAIVWIMGDANATKLIGLDGDSGNTIYSGGNCTNVHQWTVPIAVKGRIVVAGDGHLCSWSPQ
jgi:hypothetical protein